MYVVPEMFELTVSLWTIAASAILFLSSVPRAAKGPVPAALSVLGAAVGYYYRKAYFS